MMKIAMAGVACVALAGCASGCPTPILPTRCAPSSSCESRGKAAEFRSADAPLRDLTGLDMEARLGAYQARDAIWVSGQPLLVNRSYDFALAASDEQGGPALAAMLRRRANVALAERL